MFNVECGTGNSFDVVEYRAGWEHLIVRVVVLKKQVTSRSGVHADAWYMRKDGHRDAWIEVAADGLTNACKRCFGLFQRTDLTFPSPPMLTEGVGCRIELHY